MTFYQVQLEVPKVVLPHPRDKVYNQFKKATTVWVVQYASKQFGRTPDAISVTVNELGLYPVLYHSNRFKRAFALGAAITVSLSLLESEQQPFLAKLLTELRDACFKYPLALPKTVRRSRDKGDYYG